MRYLTRRHDIDLTQSEWNVLEDFIQKAQGADGDTLKAFVEKGLKFKTDNVDGVTGAFARLSTDVQSKVVVVKILNMVQEHRGDICPPAPPAKGAAAPANGKAEMKGEDEDDGGGVIIITHGGNPGGGIHLPPPFPGNGHHGGHGGGPGRPEHGGGPEEQLV